MKIKKFFEPTTIREIDIFLENLSDKEMPQQIVSFTKKQLKDHKGIDSTAVVSDNVSINGDVCIGAHVIIEDYVVIKGPVIIYDNAFIGQHSLIRSGSVIGRNSTIGHSCEIANTMILNDTVISHYNVLSSSLVGSNVNFSAFASTAAYLIKNEKIKNQDIPVILHNDNYEIYQADSYKFGSIIGDNCRIGALTLLNPGVIMEKNCIVYPLLNIPNNYYHENSSIYKEEYLAQFFIQKGERFLNPQNEKSYYSHIKAIKIND